MSPPTGFGYSAFYLLAFIFLGSSILVNHFSDESSTPYLSSEWVCWSILSALAFFSRRSRQFVQVDGHFQSDKLALAIAAAAVCWAWGEARWAVPLITPACLLLSSLSTVAPKLPLTESEKPIGWNERLQVEAVLPVKSLALAVAIAVPSAAFLVPLPLAAYTLGTGLCFALCFLVVYVILHQSKQDAFGDEQPSSTISIPAQGTCWRVVAVLTMMLFIPSSRQSAIDIPLVVIIGLFKAVGWVAIFELINRGFLIPLSTIMTFAVSSQQALKIPLASSKTELVAAIALVSLAQTYQHISRLPHSRHILFALTIFLFTGLILRHPLPMSFDLRASFLREKAPHPIELLVKEANQKFAAMVNHQSKTVEQAVAEYERRYDRLPPPGFDKWFQLAQEADCPIVDEFDTVMHTLEPFWGFSAQEFQARARMVPGDPFLAMEIKNHTVNIFHDTLVLAHFNEIVLEWTRRHQDLFPDMLYVVNGLAEPRVIAPNDRLEHLIHSCAPPAAESLNGTRKNLEVLDLGKESSWQIGMRSCPEDSPSRALVIPDEDNSGIEFVQNVTLAKDWCMHPKAAQRHAMFSSPYNMKITDTMVPIFSHGKPSTSQDILYPSPDYLDGYRAGRYKEEEDGPWEDKTNKLYWVGSDTGGYARGNEWHEFHRQRFVELLSNGENEISLLRRDTSGGWQSYPEKMANLTDLAEVKFSSIDACSHATCHDEFKSLPVGQREDPSRMHGYRFLFDVDGMGRTERYYRLLGSHSTVLKQTMHQEWHDDRLVPWVHYVPISLSMNELPETLRFLALTEKGQKISKDIADAGRDWQRRALREKDMELAFVRILLEYGRLYSEDRDLEGYCPSNRRRLED